MTLFGHKGNSTVRHVLRTAGRSARIELKAEKESLTADDKDVCFIEPDAVDPQGLTVRDARPWIHFVVEGPARLQGGATHIDAISGVAAINVQSTGQQGEIVVTGSSPGLEPGRARIQVFGERHDFEVS